MITPSFSLTATERVLPKLALDFTTAALDSRVTFTRTTGASNPATYTDASGLIVASTNNQPRFDHDPISLACKGLLIEESRTNILIGSDGTGSFGNSTGLTFSSITVPDGTSVNCVWNNTGNNTNRYEVVINGGVYASGTNFVWSWYQKKINTTETGAVITPQSLVNATVVSAPSKIEDFNNGWERWSTRLSITDGAVLTRFRMYITAPSLNVFNAFAVWGNQVEAGAFATSYIPTTTTALTRNADVATMTGTNFSDWFNPTEGTLKVVGSSYSNTFAYFALINNGVTTDENNIYIRRQTDKKTFGAVRTTTFTFGQAGSTIADNELVEMSLGYKVDNMGFADSGGAFGSSSNAALPTGMTQMILGKAQGNFLWLNGHLSKLFYYPQRLTDNELKSISRS